MHERRCLSGTRVRLSGLERAHLERRVEFINNSEVQATLNFDFPTSRARTEAWFGKNVLSATRVDLTIEAVDGPEIIGFCGFLGIDFAAKRAEHYIFIGNTNYWGRGYGREAYKLLTNYGFSELGLNRIWGFQLEGNDRASRLTDSLGWKVEGRLRQDAWSHGRLKDRKIIAILRNEWMKNTEYDNF